MRPSGDEMMESPQHKESYRMDPYDYIEQHAVVRDHAGFHAAVHKLISLVEANVSQGKYLTWSYNRPHRYITVLAGRRHKWRAPEGGRCAS